ncbi:MAG TPA: anthranilate synthase component I family protein [Pirellulaceae bacterium]|nr:anthranilate synthase component I family protein [Pirellulaceae bacterium]
MKHDSLPLAIPLPNDWTPRQCLQAFAELPGCLALESSQVTPQVGRFSFVAADPIAWFGPDDSGPIWERERRRLTELAAPKLTGLPPFQGGLAGAVSFEFIRQWERLPNTAYDPMAMPGYRWGLYDVVLAWDHEAGRQWLISQGWPSVGQSRSPDWARARANKFLDLIGSSHRLPIREQHMAPCANMFPTGHQVLDWPELRSNFSREGYLNAAQRAIDYVWKGDVFQVNLAQHLWAPATCSALELYLRSAAINPAPFSGYWDLGDLQIVSASPERLLAWRDGSVETRPIKGTRRRGVTSFDDLQTADNLSSDPKEVAENTMIVDLMRNDLSRFCEPDSVVVTRHCGVERFATVMHLVSVVEGRVQTGVDAMHALRCVLPGGSVSGAPKLRALEIIAELENMARGAYCGALGYISASGDADFNIMIRTLTARDGWWHFPVGGAIVADSVPENEYDETWAKAIGMLQAIGLHDLITR